MTNICLAFLGSGVSFIFGYTHILLAPNGAPHVNLPTVNDVGECVKGTIKSSLRQTTKKSCQHNHPNILVLA